MNATNGKDATNILAIPYNYADPDTGFLYKGTIDTQEYVRNMVQSYNKYMGKIQPIQDNWEAVYGTNIARYNNQKERNTYKQQQTFYEETRVNLLTEDRQEMTIDALIKHFQDKKPFILVMNLYQLGSDEHVDLLADMMRWAQECRKLTQSNMNTYEILRVASKKNLRLRFEDAKSTALLENARMMKVLNNRTFSFLVERITFVV